MENEIRNDIFIGNERRHLHKGFYIESGGNVEKYLLNIRTSRTDYNTIFPYIDAQVFLKGSCDLFALALNREFGYKAYAFKIINKKDSLIHCFCVSDYCGMPAYVDVRGVTTDFEELIYPFEELRNFEFELAPFNLEEVQKLEEENAEIGFEFAKYLIEKYYDYYEHNNCVQPDIKRPQI